MKRSMVPLSVLAALVAGLTFSHFIAPAQAQSAAPPAAVCKWSFQGKNLQEVNDSIQGWMNEQLGAGHRQFVVVPISGAANAVCVW